MESQEGGQGASKRAAEHGLEGICAATGAPRPLRVAYASLVMMKSGFSSKV